MSSSFISTTDRSFSQQIQNEVKRGGPSIGSYAEVRQIGRNSIDGGAPSNFLLLKNDKLAAPFGSTVKKGWLNFEKGKQTSAIIF
jgi:hypothetical protein